MKLKLATMLGVAAFFSLACSGQFTAEPTTPSTPPSGTATAIAGAGTQADPKQLTCSTTAKELGDFGASTYVKCPASCTTGIAWGTCTYTTDSSVCVSANHAGALPGDPYPGGTTKLNSAPGQQSYAGSTNGKITTSQWATFDKSFAFDTCTATVTTTTEPTDGDKEGRGGRGGGGGGGGGRGGGGGGRGGRGK